MTQSTADVTITTETLKTALGLVSKAMGKSSLPILSTIHISGSQAAQEISLSATDLETAVSMRVPASVARDWGTCAPGETLTSLAGAAGGEFTEFTFEPESVTLRLKSQSMKSKLKCLEGSEFPIIAAADTDTQVMTGIPANSLRSALKHVVIAASSDESRPVLCSVQLALIDEQVCLTAADGFRLATCRLEEEVVFPGKTSLIIPRASVLKLAAILPDDETPVQVAVTQGDRALIVSWGRATFRAQLLDGTYPDWRAIFPQEWAHELTLSANAFQCAVKRAEIFARDTPSRILRITPDASSDGTLIYSEAETGRGDTLLAEAAMPIPMAFNSIFVRQGLDAIQGTPVHIRLNASNAPMLLSNGTDKFRYLLMPLHTAEEVSQAAAVAQASEDAAEA
jgi:DNA polymerase III subunit beta